MANSRSRKRRRGAVSLAWTLVLFAALTGVILWLDDRGGTTIVGPARAIDGDSLLISGKQVRLMGIDAPELRQECRLSKGPWRCGTESRSALRKLIQGQQVECRTHGLDRYQRRLAICFANGVELNAHMVEGGWAVDYGGYASEEGLARRNRVGLWRGEFDLPSDWRQINRSQSSAAPASFVSWWNRARLRLKQMFFDFAGN